MLAALSEHWARYFMEAALLGLFMLSACAVVAAASHPASPVSSRLRRPLLRRACIGAAMGITAILLITSPWGKRSGAHMNPAVTLAFWWLGKLPWTDAVWYGLAQCVGAILGVALARLLVHPFVAHESVDHAMTRPGRWGQRVAWCAEFATAFVHFLAVLLISNSPALAAFTPYCAGALVMSYITFESPLSGFSINPARTLGSAVFARGPSRLWLYFSAPPIAMLLASVAYVSAFGAERVYCCKLDHSGQERCEFEGCRFDEIRAAKR